MTALTMAAVPASNAWLVKSFMAIGLWSVGSFVRLFPARWGMNPTIAPAFSRLGDTTIALAMLTKVSHTRQGPDLRDGGSHAVPGSLSSALSLAAGQWTSPTLLERTCALRLVNN